MSHTWRLGASQSQAAGRVGSVSPRSREVGLQEALGRRAAAEPSPEERPTGRLCSHANAQVAHAGIFYKCIWTICIHCKYCEANGCTHALCMLSSCVNVMYMLALRCGNGAIAP